MNNIEYKKESVSRKLSEQYSRNIINIEEYERILEYINKIETQKEIYLIEKIIHENENNAILIPETNTKQLSLFSWKQAHVKPVNGNGGKYISVFGVNRIIVGDLPEGRTIIETNAIFGLTEILVPKNIRIVNKTVPVFSGVFIPDTLYKENENKELPELYIIGKAVFGNITIKTIE